MGVRILLAFAMLLAGCKEKRRDDVHWERIAAINRAIARGAGFLASRQDDEGAIVSPTYAAFRDGYALTGLAAMALTFSPDGAQARAKAIGFLATMVDASPPPAYPTFAAALAVLAMNAPGNEAHRATRDRLRELLRSRQLGPALGWTAADASYGGWGYYPIVPRRPAGAIGDDMLSSNLSATVLVVGALTLGGVPPDDPALVLARGFVERCQHPRDGGFFFSPAVPDANKAGADGDTFRSYGSMTADGIRALLRLGVPLDDPRITRAAAWLDAHFDAARNPGDFPPVAEVRRDSAYYYWAWTAAHAMRALGRPPERWAAPLVAELLARQQPDGYWQNPATEMREDDPVVATSFAIAALTVCRAAINGEHQSHAGWK